jgi:hypothetical protein
VKRWVGDKVWGGQAKEVARTMYTHKNKLKTIKKEKINFFNLINFSSK